MRNFDLWSIQAHPPSDASTLIVLHVHVLGANLLIRTRAISSKKDSKPRPSSPGIFAPIHDLSEEHCPNDLGLSEKLLTYKLDVSKNNPTPYDPISDLWCTKQV